MSSVSEKITQVEETTPRTRPSSFLQKSISGTRGKILKTALAGLGVIAAADAKASIIFNKTGEFEQQPERGIIFTPDNDGLLNIVRPDTTEGDNETLRDIYVRLLGGPKVDAWISAGGVSATSTPGVDQQQGGLSNETLHLDFSGTTFRELDSTFGGIAVSNAQNTASVPLTDALENSVFEFKYSGPDGETTVEFPVPDGFTIGSGETIYGYQVADEGGGEPGPRVPAPGAETLAATGLLGLFSKLRRRRKR